MVKNTKGGKGAKSMARKLIHNTYTSTSLRLPEEVLEVFAIVTKMYGNMCQVFTSDNRDLKCHIRGKFKGRSKRNSFISAGSIILIGYRHYEAPHFQSCDLLEVYESHEVSSLLSFPSYNISYLLSMSNPDSNANNNIDDSIFTVDNSALIIQDNNGESSIIDSPSNAASSSLDELILDI
jgi:translation initiation factor IF-1